MTIETVNNDADENQNLLFEEINNLGTKRIRIDQLPRAVFYHSGVTSGQVNPNWIESLMGFPIGWTDLEVDDPIDPRTVTNPDAPDWLNGFKYVGDPDDYVSERVVDSVVDYKPLLIMLGNAVVPQIPEILGRLILEIEKQTKEI